MVELSVLFEKNYRHTHWWVVYMSHVHGDGDKFCSLGDTYAHCMLSYTAAYCTCTCMQHMHVSLVYKLLVTRYMYAQATCSSILPGHWIAVMG